MWGRHALVPEREQAVQHSPGAAVASPATYGNLPSSLPQLLFRALYGPHCREMKCLAKATQVGSRNETPGAPVPLLHPLKWKVNVTRLASTWPCAPTATHMPKHCTITVPRGPELLRHHVLEGVGDQGVFASFAPGS